jgi:hypothetical protein
VHRAYIAALLDELVPVFEKIESAEKWVNGVCGIMCKPGIWRQAKDVEDLAHRAAEDVLGIDITTLLLLTTLETSKMATEILVTKRCSKCWKAHIGRYSYCDTCRTYFNVWEARHKEWRRKAVTWINTKKVPVWRNNRVKIFILTLVGH